MNMLTRFTNAKAMALACLLSIVAAPAFAAGGGGGGGASGVADQVIALIEDYGAQAVLIVTAMLLAVWAIKALGLFRRG